MSFPDEIVDKNQYDELVTEGGKEFFAEMVELFEEHLPPIIEDLINASKGDDANQVSELAHSIKGSAANIGVKTVYNLSKKLEIDATKLSQDEIINFANQIKEQFEKCLPALKSLL